MEINLNYFFRTAEKGEELHQCLLNFFKDEESVFEELYDAEMDSIIWEPKTNYIIWFHYDEEKQEIYIERTFTLEQFKKYLNDEKYKKVRECNYGK